VAKNYQFSRLERHGIKEEAWQTHSVEVREAVYHKPVLHNHHMQYTKFKCKHNLLYY